jgi:demethylmenaquinone methyltransferase/2-methoxy-6-polyprenyl-1,4-benzoquinol methylase
MSRLQNLDGLGQTFGTSRVSAEQRRIFVRALFDSVALRYDLMNDLMSLGLHRWWKRRTVQAVVAALAPEGGFVVDLAGGTGDLAQGVKTALPAARVEIVDASPAMLAVARHRLGGSATYCCAEAERLPIASNTVAAVTLAFGLRNMTDPAAALREVLRILAPGSKIFLLEFSKPAAWFAPFYNLFSVTVIPALGALIAANRQAYRYLVESIRLFPDAQSISQELERAGFSAVEVHRFSFGVAALHIAVKAK